MDIIIVDNNNSFLTTLTPYIRSSGDFNVLKTFSSYSETIAFMHNKSNALVALLIFEFGGNSQWKIL